MNDQGLQQNHHEFYKVNMSMSAISLDPFC